METTRRRLLEERWDVITSDVARTRGEASITGINSGRWTRANRTLEEMAAQLVDEVDGAETDDLVEVMEQIWGDIRVRLLDWAERVEVERESSANAILGTRRLTGS